jgi:hypothetical protein
MNSSPVVDIERSSQRLKALEYRYRSALNSLTSARASYLSLREVMDSDALELKQALVRIGQQQQRLDDLQSAMELIEDGLDAA